MRHFKKPIAFLNNPTFLGQKKFGVNFAPKILTHKYNNVYDSFPTISNNDILDLDYPIIKDMVFWENEQIYKNNIILQKEYNQLVNIGGDHSIAMGSVSASLKEHNDQLKVIWIDAHADINSFESSTTKNMHGMSVNFLMNIEKNIPRWLKKHKLLPEQLLYIGIRDLDQYEIELINDKKIDFITMPMINKYGLKNLLETYDDDLFNKIHISLDVDSINPNIMPSTGTPVPSGLTMDEIYTIINHYKEQTVCVDLVEFNPLIGEEDDIIMSYTHCQNILDQIHRNATILN